MKKIMIYSSSLTRIPYANISKRKFFSKIYYKIFSGNKQQQQINNTEHTNTIDTTIKSKINTRLEELKNINNENTNTNNNTNTNKNNQEHNITNNTETNKDTELTNTTNTNLQELNEKYSLYSNYNVIEPLKKDSDFGEVATYDDFLDRGLEKVDRSNPNNNLLLKYYTYDNLLKKDEDYNMLSKFIHQKSKMFSTQNFKEEYKYKLNKHEERWYKESIYSREVRNELSDIINHDTSYTTKQSVKPLRNTREEYRKMHRQTLNSNEPIAEMYPLTISISISNSIEEKLNDNFHYLKDEFHSETFKYKQKEKIFFDKIFAKYTNTMERIMDDFEDIIDHGSFCALEFGTENNSKENKENKKNSSMFVFRNSFHSNDFDSIYMYNPNLDNTIIPPDRRGDFFLYSTQRNYDNVNLETLDNIIDNTSNINIDLNSKNTYTIFSLNDLLNLNTVYTNLDFINFTKSMLDSYEQNAYEGNGTIIKSFYLDSKSEYAVLVVNNSSTINNNLNLKNDTKNSQENTTNTPPSSLLIKDIYKNILLPVIIHNTNKGVAFDKHYGIYYTQMDFTGRSNKVFRHQIGKDHGLDVLIYEEKNLNYEVKTYNCNAYDFVYIEIYTNSNFKSPNSNEIWIKEADDIESDFNLIKKLEIGCYYSVKYSRSNSSLYIMMNKYNSYDNMMKVIPYAKKNKEEIKRIEDYGSIKNLSTELTTLKNDNEDNDNNREDLYETFSSSTTNTNNTTSTNNTNSTSDTSNTSNFNNTNTNTTNTTNNTNTNNTNNLNNENINILDFTLLSNYLITLEEEEQQTNYNNNNNSNSNINITNQENAEETLDKQTNNNNQIESKSFSKYFRITKLLNPSNPSNPTNSKIFRPPSNITYNMKLFENNNYSSQYLRFKTSSKSLPDTIYDYSIGTSKLYQIHNRQYSYKIEKYYIANLDSDTLNIVNRNNLNIEIKLFYNKDLYNNSTTSNTSSNSHNPNPTNPFILYTNGAASNSSLTEFDELQLSLINKGFVLAFPIIRGTKFHNTDFLVDGIAENKINHFTDFIDCALHIKQMGLTNNLILYAEHYGAVTGILSIYNTSRIFDLVVFKNGVFDLLDVCANVNIKRRFSGYDNSISENTIFSEFYFKEEFGDYSNNKEFYELMKLYSPYHLHPPSYLPSMLYYTDKSFMYNSHSYKMTAKFRRKNLISKRAFSDCLYDVLIHDGEYDENYEESIAYIYGFIVGESYLKNNKI